MVENSDSASLTGILYCSLIGGLHKGSVLVVVDMPNHSQNRNLIHDFHRS